MFTERDCRRWLAEDYPSLFLRRGQNDRMGIWQMDKYWKSFRVGGNVMEDEDGPFEFGGYEFGYLQVGYSLVFEITPAVSGGRLFGGWIKDEVQRRDPRLWHNPGNAFHEAYIASRKADKELEERTRDRRESGEAMWKAVKTNHKLMNRIAKHMERGDMLRAGRELSLEELYRNATLENPKEMRSKHFAKAALGPIADRLSS